jgi:hypothetical protein
MKRLALLSAFCFSLFGAAPVLAENQAAPTIIAVSAPSPLAPADRYFGKLKMSVLGMRNAIKDITAVIDATDSAATNDLAKQYHKLTFVEDALLDLKTQYPADSWIAPLGLNLAKAFVKLHIEDATVDANDTVDWLIAEYPKTTEGFLAKDLLNTSFVVIPVTDIPIESTIGPDSTP